MSKKKERGRPTKYNKEIQEKAEYYLDNHHKRAIGDVVPSISSLAYYLCVTDVTVHNWRAKHEDFKYVADRVVQKQHIALLNGGLTNALNPTIVKLMLSNHGYSEKQQVSHSVDNSVKTYQDMYGGYDQSEQQEEESES